MTAEELKARKAELQRKRQALVDAGKSPKLLDRMISGVDRAKNAAQKAEKAA